MAPSVNIAFEPKDPRMKSISTAKDRFFAAVICPYSLPYFAQTAAAELGEDCSLLMLLFLQPVRKMVERNAQEQLAFAFALCLCVPPTRFQTVQGSNIL